MERLLVSKLQPN